MKLRDRLGLAPKPAPAAEDAKEPVLRVVTRTQSTPADRSYQDLKLRIHRDLIDRIDLGNIARTDLASANAELRGAIAQLIDEQAVPLTQRDRERLGEEILHEVHGLGPIEPLLRDPDVCDILVNTARQVYVERAGKLELTPVVFRDSTHLLQIIDRIVSRVGRRIDESSPMVDARLPDGSRVNAVIPPLALDGPLLSIRRFGRDPLTIKDLVSLGSLTPELSAVREMGCGLASTSRLAAAPEDDDPERLSSFIPRRAHRHDRGPPSPAQQPHVCRPGDSPAEHRGSRRDHSATLRNTLRMRPDRIIVGECRGAETLDMLQAMNTGHDGSISTVHANSARDALSRLETMIQMAGFDLPSKAMRQQVSQALDVIVQTARLADGSRRVTGLSEVVGMEGDTIMMQELFAFQREGVEDGRIIGRVVSTGIRPRFAERMKASSQEVDATVFDYLKG